MFFPIFVAPHSKGYRVIANISSCVNQLFYPYYFFPFFQVELVSMVASVSSGFVGLAATVWVLSMAWRLFSKKSGPRKPLKEKDVELETVLTNDVATSTYNSHLMFDSGNESFCNSTNINMPGFLNRV